MNKKLLFKFFSYKFVFLLLLCCCATNSANANLSDLLQQKSVTINMQNKPIKSILLEIQKQTGLNFAYNEAVLASYENKSMNVSNVSVESALKSLFKGTDLTYQINGNTINITKLPAKKEKPTGEIIKGKVIDSEKKPLPGATVIVKGTNVGAIVDAGGNFAVNAMPGDVLQIEYLGYVPVELRVKEETQNVLIQMKAEVMAVDDVVVTAFGQRQTKESLVGSVTSVNAKQLKSSSSDLTTSFAGNIAGMVAWQTGGIPGALTEEEMNTKFYIRGITSFQAGANVDPLILLDGVESSKLDLARIDPEDIESFSVLKDAAATAMYGARGANGVIYVTTKKGQSGSVYTSVRYETVASMPTRDIDVINPVDYMKLYNEAYLGRNPYATPRYSKERIENTNNPNLPYYVNPGNDWYETMFKPMSMNHRLAVNIRGGSDRVQYYASVNYNQDNGMLKTDQLNQFDVNIKNQGFTLRTNLNIDLNKGIKLVVNSFSTLDRYHGPLADVKQAYYMAFGASPVDFATTYPADDYYKWNHIRFGGSETSANPYAQIHEGYTDRMRYSTKNKIEYIHDLSFITKNLEFRGSASLSQEGYFTTSFATTPYFYSLKNYDYATGKHELLPINDGASRVLNPEARNASSTAETQMGFDVRLIHTAAWKDHTTSALLLFNMQETRMAMPKNLFNSFPQRNLGLAANATYGYKQKYFAQASFGYNGSERFAKKNRMGFFPSLGCSWVVSKEKFMEPMANIIPFLKVRYSWGKVGNDGIIKDPRFVHLTTITKSGSFQFRPFTPEMIKMYTIQNYANPEVTWEVGEQMNLGFDLSLFNKIVELNADIYREVRHNVLDYRVTIPSTLGLSKPALDNVGKVESKGIDLALKVQHAFTSDLWIILNGTFTYNRAEFLEIEEASNKPAWQKKVGREISQSYGYIAEGLFTDEAEIVNSPFQGGDVMPGDIRYRDINDDRKIDIFDAVPIGYPETPRIIYGFNAFVNYKNFEFNISFQGMGQRSFFIDPQAISPFHGNKAVLTEIANDHWTPSNVSNKPFWPRLSTDNIIKHNPQENYASNAEIKKSTYFMNNGQFLRCKAIEIGYNLPKKVSEKIRLRNIKVYARTNNPFVITPFGIWDIELGSTGFNYPIQRTYSAGINVSF